MNVSLSPGAEQQCVEIRFTNALDIVEISGDCEEVLGLNPVSLWRRNAREVLPASVADGVASSISQPGGSRPQTCSGPDGRQLLLVAQSGQARGTSDHFVSLRPLSAEAGWAEQKEATLRTDGQSGRDEFLDDAALAMSRGDAAMTTIVVDGGLNELADARFGQILHDEAMRNGGLATSRLDEGHYGILHRTDANEADMVGAITSTARTEGVLEPDQELSSERIDGDGSEVSVEEIRATLAYSTGGLRDRLKAGLRRIGLIARRDEARERARRLIDQTRKAISEGRLSVETRPVLSLAKGAVAMRQIRCHPVVDGRIVETDVLEALAEAPGLLAEIEAANVERSLDMQNEMKLWQSVSLRVMVSMRETALGDKRLMRDVRKGIRKREVSPGKLLIRPYRPLSGNMMGAGGALFGVSEGEDWRVVVSDFYAFLQADRAHVEPQERSGDPATYIEVACDRLLRLNAERDGGFLLKELVRTWRLRGTEIIATAVDRESDFGFLKEIGVRYASGEKVGGWRIE